MPTNNTTDYSDTDAREISRPVSSRPLDVFLRPGYISDSFSASERLDCYLFNFHFLASRFSPSALAELAGPGIILFNQDKGSRKYTYRLAISGDRYQDQGELSLILNSDDTTLYNVTFSIVPGYVVLLRATAAIFISRMQGDRSLLEAIVADDNVSPQDALFSVLRGLAKALKIKYIFGVSAKVVAESRPLELQNLNQTYDEFFLSIGAQGPIGGLFHLGPTGLREGLSRGLADSRTKAKRKVTLEISRASEGNALKRLLSAEERGPPAKTAVKVGRAIAAINSLLPTGESRWMTKPLATMAAKLDPPRTELAISAAHLHSNVGTRVGKKIVATGAEGFLVFGPYLTLRASRYSVRFALETNAPTAFRVEIVADQANRMLVQKEFRPSRPIAFADVEFETSTDYYDVEFRLFVFPGASMQFSGIEIKRLDRHSIFLEGL